MWIQSLIRELKFHMPCGTAPPPPKNTQTKNTFPLALYNIATTIVVSLYLQSAKTKQS